MGGVAIGSRGGGRGRRAVVSVGKQAYVFGAAAHDEEQGDCQQQGEYAQHPIGYSPTGEGGYCGDYLYVDSAAHGPEGGYEAYGQAAAPVEEVDGDGAWHDAYEAWVGNGASDDVGGVEVPDLAYAAERDEGRAGDERGGGHEAARSVLIYQPSEYGG